MLSINTSVCGSTMHFDFLSQHKRAKIVLGTSLLRGITCITVLESVVQKTEMEAMVTRVMEEAKSTVATASVANYN